LDRKGLGAVESARRLLADAAYRAEHGSTELAEVSHRLCRDEPGIRSTVIALNQRSANGPLAGRYRGQMVQRFLWRAYERRWHKPSPAEAGYGPRRRVESHQPQQAPARAGQGQPGERRPWTAA
jgi:hypothetical protein